MDGLKASPCPDGGFGSGMAEPRAKKPCRTWLKTGTCSRGETCHFAHEDDGAADSGTGGGGFGGGGEGINAVISRAIGINTIAQQISTGLLGDRTVTDDFLTESSIDDFLDVEHRRSIWIKCTGGRRAGQWREVWPYSKMCKEGGTEMVRFRCFEDERHTARGRKTWYDICTVSHAEARKPDGVGEQALCMNENFGPCFGSAGGGGGLWLLRKADPAHCFTTLGDTYALPPGQADPHFLAGAKQFTVAEVEVFRVRA